MHWTIKDLTVRPASSYSVLGQPSGPSNQPCTMEAIATGLADQVLDEVCSSAVGRPDEEVGQTATLTCLRTCQSGCLNYAVYSINRRRAWLTNYTVVVTQT